MNGWRRLWLALTGLAVIVAVVTGLFQAGTHDDGSWRYTAGMRKDFDNPACRDFATKPFSELKEPEYSDAGGTCYYIYTHRQFLSDRDQPVTMDSYEHYRLVQTWQNIGTLIGIYLVLVAVTSAIVYGIGKTVAWIRAGFRDA